MSGRHRTRDTWPRHRCVPPPERLYANDLSWDKDATHMEDRGSYFPVAPLLAAREDGRIGDLAERFHCVPTDYSKRRTREVDAPEILKRCREDAADVALLVPALTRVPPDRESGRAASRSERHPHRGSRLRPRHRRTLRRRPLRLRGLSLRQPLRQARRRGHAGKHRQLRAGAVRLRPSTPNHRPPAVAVGTATNWRERYMQVSPDNRRRTQAARASSAAQNGRPCETRAA